MHDMGDALAYTILGFIGVASLIIILVILFFGFKLLTKKKFTRPSNTVRFSKKLRSFK